MVRWRLTLSICTAASTSIGTLWPISCKEWGTESDQDHQDTWVLECCLTRRYRGYKWFICTATCISAHCDQPRAKNNSTVTNQAIWRIHATSLKTSGTHIRQNIVYRVLLCCVSIKGLSAWRITTRKYSFALLYKNVPSLSNCEGISCTQSLFRCPPVDLL